MTQSVDSILTEVVQTHVPPPPAAACSRALPRDAFIFSSPLLSLRSSFPSSLRSSLRSSPPRPLPLAHVLSPTHAPVWQANKHDEPRGVCVRHVGARLRDHLLAHLIPLGSGRLRARLPDGARRHHHHALLQEHARGAVHRRPLHCGRGRLCGCSLRFGTIGLEEPLHA